MDDPLDGLIGCQFLLTSWWWPTLPIGLFGHSFQWFALPRNNCDRMACFLTDEMLAGLARWLRAAGYDTARAPLGATDGALVALAAAQSRLLITRDRAILERKAAFGKVVMLEGTGLDAWAGEMAAKAGVDWLRAPFTRCLLCNGELTPAPAEVAPELPAGADVLGPVRWCASCRKSYWRGGHVRRMEARLARWGRAVP